MSDKVNTTRLTGLRPLAYTGVVAKTPPQLVYGKSEPDMSNAVGFAIGSIWMVLETRKVFMLTGLSGAPADWTQIYPETSETSTFPVDVGVALSDDLGELNVFGGRSMVTEGLHSTLAIRSDNNLLVLGTLTLPLLGTGFIRSSNMGLLSSFIDGTDGQLLIASSLGLPAWHSVTSGDASLTITPGANSLDITVTASGVGYVKVLATDTGVATPAAGVITVGGGLNINTSGATSIVTINLDNTISVPGDITAGTDITCTTNDIVTLAGDIIASGLVTAGTGLTVNAGPIELSSFTAGVVQSDASGILNSSNGTDGQVLIGGGANAVWANLLSSDASVGIISGPNSIDLASLGDKDRILGDTGYAIPDGTSTITVAGGTNITTPAGAATLTCNLDNSITLSGGITVTPLNGTLYVDGAGLFDATDGIDGQFMLGVTGAIHEWRTPVSEDATMTINPGTVAGTLNFQSTGGGGSGTLDTMSGDTGGAIPIGGDIQIAGGDNITTTAAGHIVTINLDKSIYQPTSTHFIAEANPEGFYFLDGQPFLHNFAWQYSMGHPPITPPSWSAGQACTYVGSASGIDSTITNVPYPPEYNTGIGELCFRNAHPGSKNSGLGYGNLKMASSDFTNDTVVGVSLDDKGSSISFHPLHGEAYYPHQIKIGGQAGHGVAPSDTQCNKCYIAGIYNGGLLDTTHREPVFAEHTGFLSSDTDGVAHVTTDGDVLIGNDTAPGQYMERSKITGISGEISVVNGPHSIDLNDNGQPCFSAYQAATVNNLTGDGTSYILGSSSVLNEYYDVGGNFYIGDGISNPAYFQAPYEGSYFFTIAITLDNLTTEPMYGDIISIWTLIDDAPNWSDIDFLNPVTNALGQQGIFASGISYLLPGDKVYFGFKADIAGCGKTIGIMGATTNVSGFLINSN